MNLTGPFCTLAELIDDRHTAGEVLDALIAANRDTTVDGPVAAFAELEMRAAGRSVIQAMVQAGVAAIRPGLPADDGAGFMLRAE